MKKCLSWGRRPSSTCAIQTVILAMIFGIVSEGAASNDVPRMPRVRSESPAIAAAIREATERSQTFRRLVETIDSSDGLVYVEEGKCRHSVRACLILSVKVAGPYRLLRILVDTRKAAGAELMAAIGHELWHANEALGERSVVDNRSMFLFFSRIGPTDSERFETGEAIKVGLSVLDEVKAQARGR
jgi:hypothetical protein